MLRTLETGQRGTVGGRGGLRPAPRAAVASGSHSAVRVARPRPHARLRSRGASHTLSLTRGAWGEEEIFVTWTNWPLSKQICLTQEKTDARRARTQTAAASSAQGAEPPGTLVA